ncbi:ArdC family protein [Phocaeicola dorei]|uniref:ArdC family protein n=1 Tax=Phocaeicola dorei TaxID=357276 RepID=UPI0039782371
MKEKSPREQSAAHQQTALLVNALNGAVAGSGYWLNAAGRNLPKFYPKGVAVSPFNSLVLGMHTDQSGYKTGLYTMFSDAKQRGEAILQQEHGVPFNWYKWDKYVNRHNSEDMLSREAYKALPKHSRSSTKECANGKSWSCSTSTRPLCRWRMRRNTGICNNASAAVQTGATCKARNDNCAAR